MNMKWPSDPHLRKWMLFVDGENLTFRGQDVAKSNSLTLSEGAHYKKDVFLWFPKVHARQALTNTENTTHVQYKAVRSFYYTSLVGDETAIRGVQNNLRKLGFEPRVFKKISRDKKTKAVDVTLVTELLSNAYSDNYDVAVIVTGDGDFISAIEEVKRRGKIVYVGFFGKYGLSPEIELSADERLELEDFFVDQWKLGDSPPRQEVVGAKQ